MSPQEKEPGGRLLSCPERGTGSDPRVSLASGTQGGKESIVGWEQRRGAKSEAIPARALSAQSQSPRWRVLSSSLASQWLIAPGPSTGWGPKQSTPSLVCVGIELTATSVFLHP